MLVGRSAACAQIEAILAGARAHRSGAVLLSGGPGVGKSALLEFARERAHDMAVLEAQGVESESELAYAGLSQLLAPVMALNERLAARQRRALAGALGLDGAEPPGERFMVYLATLSLLAQAAEERPVLVLIDDVHWLDTASAEALSFVTGRLGSEAIAVLLAAREGIHATLRARRMETLELDGVDVDAAAELLREVAPVPVSRSVVEALHRQTGGVPLGLLEVARLLSPGQLAGSHPLPDPLPAGPDLEGAFGARIAALPGDAQRALLLAAAHDGSDLQPLARAWRARGLDASALAQAEAAGLVTIAAGRLEFAHPLLRSVTYSRATGPQRRDAHAALASAFGDAGRERLRRAWHLAAAALEPHERIAGELEIVARDAQRRAAPTTAGRALETAARMSPNASARVDRLLSAAGAYHVAGDAASALRLLNEAQAETADPLVQADVQLLRARVKTMRGAAADTRAMLVDEADRVEPLDGARAATLLLEAAAVSFMLGEPPEALRLAERAFPMAQPAGAPLTLIAALILGSARILCGDAATGEPLVTQARPLRESGQPSVLGQVAVQLSVAQLWLGHYEQARPAHEDLIRRIRAEGALTALPVALGALAFLHFHGGDLRLAHAAATEASEVAETLELRSLDALNRTALGFAAGSLGNLVEARSHLDCALALAHEFGIGSAVTMAGWARGQVELSVGAYDDAIAELERAGQWSLESGLEEPGVAWWAQDLAEAYIRVDRSSDSEATLAILERQADRTGRPLAHAGAARCRGLLAGDEEFEHHFQRALTYHEHVACPLEHARTELCFGERLRRARRRIDARAPLRRALATFERIGAEPWAEQARRELRATGERARRRVPEAMHQLTPQEVQVAAQVAGGATNREAAAALFVSPKTIEAHLARVYRKLGIRSRTELARRLREAPV